MAATCRRNVTGGMMHASYPGCARWDWGSIGREAAIGGVVGAVTGAAFGASGPSGPLFGRGRYRGGNPGIFNKGDPRTGWSYDEASGRNWFSRHGGTPSTPGHYHNDLFQEPRNGGFW